MKVRLQADSDIFVRKRQHVLNRLNDYESSITPTKRQSREGKSQLHQYYTISILVLICKN